ncbi:MAG: LytTR family DNA-binding domain-containing protein [Candidatus Azobacteroides sp.]|nr:LytTR family DNA-binding domain-containing protein [Candidatus Azobacteroides sp.]
MNCIIIDDEPLAREAVELLIREDKRLTITGTFGNTRSASVFLSANMVDLIFLDIQMPGVNGIDFAKTIPRNTLVIFTTAFSEYALDSYEVDALDYLVKPIEYDRFWKSVDKAFSYHTLLINEEKERIEDIMDDFFFVKSERKYLKINYNDILFVEALKDYVVIHLCDKKIITKMYLKTIQDLLPETIFFRINRSYIVNLKYIDSFDNNDVFTRNNEIAIGNGFRDAFFRIFSSKKI